MFAGSFRSRRVRLTTSVLGAAAIVVPVSMGAAAGAATTATTAAAARSAAAPGAAGAGTYIVQMVGDPVATSPATRPARGSKLNPASTAATRYRAVLRTAQSRALARSQVPSSRVIYHYTTALNGVAVRLTAAQASRLAKDPGVVQLWKNRILHQATPPTPQFLGLTGRTGVWRAQFGSDANAGNGVIIGDIDTGFWPESPSFAPLPEPRSDDATIAAAWHGICDTTGPNPVACNNKVIGARFFDSAGLSHANPGEHANPRDYDGHGSHTASTAAGDHVLHPTVNGVDVGDLEGVAPGARLAVYKVLYENASNTTASGSGADIVAAVDTAVSDGVDVINYSIGDNIDSFGPEELAFLNASAAGVFVSAAAGNAGPGASTIDNAMPWETTDAAGTFGQQYNKSVTLGNGSTYTGIGRGPAVPSSPLIDSVGAGLSGADPAQVELCFSGTLDPAKVTGKIVLCKRGTNARIDKSLAVQRAGGVGMVLYNTSDAQELDADFHYVPTVHVSNTNGLAIKTYIAGTASPTASLSASVVTTVEAPVVAGFSSRGPSLFNGGSLLKPDVMAPGVDVVAAVSPQNHGGNLYDSESGTSMATPHITGLAALIRSKHPSWDPAAVKSVIMTGAKTTDTAGKPISTGTGAATPFDMGSGQTDPKRSFDTELVYDAGIADWLRYSCTVGVHLFAGSGDVCNSVGSFASVTDLNYPSIAFGALAGSQSTTRTVTNVTRHLVVYRAQVKAPAGYTAKVTPGLLVVPAGRKASVKVTLTRTTAPFGTYAFGELRLVGLGGRLVRSPIAAQAVPLAAPATFAGTGSTGSTSLPVQAGYTGTLTASVAGLAPAAVSTIPLVQDSSSPFNPSRPAVSPATGRVDFTAPAGTQLTRVRTYASDYPAGTDVDLFAYVNNGGSLSQVGMSAGSTADEQIDLPAGHDYAVFVNVFAGTGTVNTRPNVFVVPPTAAGNLTASPASQAVSIGRRATVTLSWSGLSAGHYLGLVNYGDGTNTIGRTVVTVDD